VFMWCLGNLKTPLGTMEMLVFFGLCSCFFVFSSYMFKVHNESSICILNADMFATLSTTLELPSYVVELAHILGEVSSPPPSRTFHINKLILDFLDIEAKQCNDDDRHDNPSC
jgi:hypothetical protein